jgi:rhomboid family GlyGly-CTERM serine protease
MKKFLLLLTKKHSLLIALIALASISTFLFEQIVGDALSEVFVYQRLLISQGEIWRLFTGHLLHTNGYHLALNLSALVMLWLLHGRFYTPLVYALLFLFSALITSIGIYYFDQDLIQYVGLSGVLHGIFVFGSIMDIRAKDKTGYILFIGVWLKIAYEQVYGASSEIIDLIEANVAVDSHLWGAVGGLIYTAIYLLGNKNKKPK